VLKGFDCAITAAACRPPWTPRRKPSPLHFALMSSIRVKKVQAPLAYIPVQRGQVAVLPTDTLPSPQQDSLINHEFLVEHARGLAGTSDAPTHSMPRPGHAASIPPSATKRRSNTLESGGTPASTKTRPISPASNSRRRSRTGSGSSWFMEHVANSSLGPLPQRPVLQTIPSQAPPAPLTQERFSTASNATLEVIIPEGVRADLAGTLQNRDSNLASLESQNHPDDIVDHLSVIGTPCTSRVSPRILRSR